MKVWIVRDQEPTPLDGDDVRMLRAGMLAQAFSERGHETIWFTSTFNHYSRKHRQPGIFRPKKNMTLHVIEAPGYRRNLGLERILHNRCFAARFLAAAQASSDRPDIILADLPTTEAAAAAVRFGVRAGVPTILSIRDLWPDFFADFVPYALRPLVWLALRPMDLQARFACRHATSLIGISQDYLKWGQEKGRRHSRSDRVFYLGYPRPRLEEARDNGVLESLGIPDTGMVVSFIGSWGATYDLDLLVQTARSMQDRQDLTFVIAGDASAQPRLANAFKALPNVQLPGWINDEQISALLRRSSIGLLPYAHKAPQGLPNKIFEYMAYGLYQLSTLPGEARVLLEKTGTGAYVASGSVADMSNSLRRLLDTPELEAGRRARQAVFESNFVADRLYGDVVGHAVEIAGSIRTAGETA